MTRNLIASLPSIILLELLLFVRAPVAADSFPNEPAGFRGIVWGTPLSENKDEMVSVKSDDEIMSVKSDRCRIDIYTRKDSKMSIGRASLSELHYGYWKNRFLVVYINTASEEDAALLRNEIEKRYGPGPWDGRVGTVFPLTDGARIYSTQLMSELFECIDADVEVMIKQLMAK